MTALQTDSDDDATGNGVLTALVVAFVLVKDGSVPYMHALPETDISPLRQFVLLVGTAAIATVQQLLYVDGERSPLYFAILIILITMLESTVVHQAATERREHRGRLVFSLGLAAYVILRFVESAEKGERAHIFAAFVLLYLEAVGRDSPFRGAIYSVACFVVDSANYQARVGKATAKTDEAAPLIYPPADTDDPEAGTKRYS